MTAAAVLYAVVIPHAHPSTALCEASARLEGIADVGSLRAPINPFAVRSAVMLSLPES